MVEYKRIFNPYTGRHQKVLDETSIGGSEPIVDQDTLNKLYDNDLLNAFRIAVNGSLTKQNMVDGIMDEFEDESGIDAIASIDEVYDNDGNYYANYSTDTSTLLLLHFEGTSVVDSSPDEHPMQTWGEITLTSSDKKFGEKSCDFASGSITASDSSKFAIGTSDFTVEAWVNPDIVGHSGFFDTRVNDPDNGLNLEFNSLGQLSEYTNTSTNAISAGIWQHVCFMRKSGILYFFIDGVDAGGSYSFTKNLTTQKCRIGSYRTGGLRFFNGKMDELRFSDIARYATTGFLVPSSSFVVTQSPQNMTLISKATEAEINPDNLRAVIMVEEIDTITINTDLKAYASRDDGANWVETTLSLEANIEDSKKVYAGTVDVSGQASDKTTRWKLQTFNNKSLKIHGVGNIWD